MSGQKDFSAYTERMFELYRAGKYALALDYVEKDMASFPEYSARITFWRMCLLSLCGRAEAALSVFSAGLEAGLWWHESQFLDTDFDSMRDLPRFKELVARSKERWKVEGIGARSERTLLEPAASGPYPLLIALHGFAGNKDSNLNYWEFACRNGWMVLSIQSRLFVFGGSSFWEAASGMEDILHHLHKIRRQYRIDGKRILLAGFSQGGGMAILAGLSPKVNAAGAIAVAGGWNEVEPFKAAAKNGRSCRCYFINGLLDVGLERSRQIQAVLKDHHIPVEEEVHPNLRHEFPPDFEKSLEKAFKFIFS